MRPELNELKIALDIFETYFGFSRERVKSERLYRAWGDLGNQPLPEFPTTYADQAVVETGKDKSLTTEERSDRIQKVVHEQAYWKEEVVQKVRKFLDTAEGRQYYD